MQGISSEIKATISRPGWVSRHSRARDYSMNPALVYWEITRACQLACRHCRAEAMSTPHPCQLTHAESKALLLQIAGFNRPLPHLILTGGDPLERDDLYELIDEARRLQLTVSITPSATSKLTAEVLCRLKEHEIDSIGLSLDGSTAARHEAVRGVEGCFEWTMSAIKAASNLGFPVQINTLIAQETLDDLPQVYELLKTLRIMRWSLFFLISVGRGKMLQPLDPQQGERCMNWAFELSQSAPFQVKTTEAPSYRRVALESMKKAGLASSQIKQSSVYRGFEIRDGHGIVFVSNQGDVYPAGFLPLKAGNVRNDHLVDIYRNFPLFCALHEPDQFRGKCGRCEYRQICGGSRARAFASSGDALASDPLCPYEPRQAIVTRITSANSVWWHYEPNIRGPLPST
jgi:AdoMet-dependent heme synthase